MANNNARGDATTLPSDAVLPVDQPATTPHAPARTRTKPAKGAATRAAVAGTAPSPGQARRAERRPEMIRQRRDERRKAYERQQRQWLYTRIGLGAFAVLVVGGLAYGIFAFVRDQALNEVPEGTREFSYAGGDHIGQGEPPTVDYAEVPPVGGKHDNAWLNCGYYQEPVRNENAVHSLEHGAVWITYRPDLPEDQIDVLKDIALDQSYILVSPYPDLPAPIVASAWNRQLTLEEANDEDLDKFIRSFRRSADAPEPQGVCTGGVGTPQQ